MTYTIARMQECGPHIEKPMTLLIGKGTTKYIVSLGRDGVWTHKSFDTLPEAHKVFDKLAGWLIYGCYSDDGRRSYLETGTMA